MGKIKNQINTLKYSSKYRKQSKLELYGFVYDRIAKMNQILDEVPKITGKDINEARGLYLSSEGRASQYY